MGDQEVKTATVEEILAVAENNQVRRVLADIFSDLHPPLSDEKSELVEMFTPESAGEFIRRITNFESLLSETDTYEQTLGKFQEQIDQAEAVRDEVLSKLFEEIRPLEASYRQIALFFENAAVPGSKQQVPVEFHVFNADPAMMRNTDSSTLGAIKKFLEIRNDDFNFRKYICNMVVPGGIPMNVREELEQAAWTWGVLLVTDLADEKSFESVVANFRTGGRYEFIKRADEKAASDVVLASTLKLRDAHWFENDNGDDLYGPASVAFAGALARTDRQTESVVQGPIGSKFGQIKGVDKARIECRIGQMELLSQKMQVIPVIRDADNHLCFFGCRTAAEDPYGVYKFFTAYRVLMYLERRIANHLRSVTGHVLTRDFMDKHVEDPILQLLEKQKEQGTILEYKLFVDKDSNKRMQGICDINIEVMPTGPAEVFRITIDVPPFKPDKKATQES
jgi:hypothetical protein